MEEVCLNFWLTMFRHELKNGEYENGLISALAIMGMNPSALGWLLATSFTLFLLALVTVIRAMVVYKA